MSYESGQVTAAITGSVTSVGTPPDLPTGAVLVVKGNGVGNGTATIHTVTAGKTLYILTCGCTVVAPAATTTGKIQADVLGDAVYADLIIHYVAAASSDSISMTFACPVTVPAGKIVRVSGDQAGSSSAGWIVGYEV